MTEFVPRLQRQWRRQALFVRLLVLLASAWWLLPPLSAALAQLLALWLPRLDAVVVASFAGPLLAILLILLGCWPKKFRAGMVLLLGCHLAAWCWYYGVAA